MFDKAEKALHTGNVAAAFGVVADVAFCGGLTTGIGAALSGTALIGKDKATQGLANQLAAASEDAFANSGLTGDRRKIVAQMLHTHRPTNDDFT